MERLRSFHFFVRGTRLDGFRTVLNCLTISKWRGILSNRKDLGNMGLRKNTEREDALKNLPPEAIDTFRATILADAQDLDMPKNLKRWASKLKESCKAPGGFALRIDFLENECTLAVLPSPEALDDEPNALYIHLTIETIVHHVPVLRLPNKELLNHDPRPKA